MATVDRPLIDHNNREKSRNESSSWAERPSSCPLFSSFNFLFFALALIRWEKERMREKGRERGVCPKFVALNELDVFAQQRHNFLVRALALRSVYVSYVFFLFSSSSFCSLFMKFRFRGAATRKLPFPFLLGSNFTAADGTVKPVGLCARQPRYLHLKRALWHGPRPRQSGELAI